MTTEPTEQDLRGALQSLVPEDLDVRDFRSRIDRLISEEPAAAPGPTPEHEVVLLEPFDRPQLRRSSRVIAVATVAACAAAVLAIAIAVLPGRTDRHTPRPAASPTAPASIKSLLYPGTVVLHTYTGQGSQLYQVAHHTLAAYTEYAVYGTCRGGGTLTISKQTLINECLGSGGFGTSPVVENGRLAITAVANTSWQLTLVIEPEARTNGSVQSPVDADMTGPDNGVRDSGHGSSSVRFTGKTPTTNYRVRLVCHGSGVALPGLTASRAKGLSTRTCFAGREYVWTSVRLTMPATVRIEASDDTTWTISIDSM